MHGLEFDWDPVKEETNLRKHGIDFVTAARIFFGPVLEFRSRYPDEVRWVAIGVADERVVTVVYTFRDGVYRLISARRASKYEREAYGQAFGG
jgi:uncharacterized protein